MSRRDGLLCLADEIKSKGERAVHKQSLLFFVRYSDGKLTKIEAEKSLGKIICRFRIEV